MSFVPEQEAHNFDMQVTTFWCHLIQCDVTSSLFFLPLKLGGLELASAVQRHAAAPWRAWQSVIPTLMATTWSPATDTLCNAAPRLRAQLVQLQTTLSLQMNKPTFLLKPLGAALRQKATQKKRVTTIQRHFHKQLLDSFTNTPVERAVLLSQSISHTGAHLMQPSSEAYEAEDRCFRVAVARRLMLPHPAAPNAADIVQSCPNKSAAVQSATNQWIHSSTTAMVVGTAEVLIADTLQWPDVWRTSYTHTVLPRCSLNTRCLLSPAS